MTDREFKKLGSVITEEKLEEVKERARKQQEQEERERQARAQAPQPQQQPNSQRDASLASTPPPPPITQPPVQKIQQQPATDKERTTYIYQKARFAQIPDIDNFFKVMRTNQLSKSAVLTYIYMCDIKTADNELYMSVNTITKIIGYKRRQVIQGIQELEKAELIRVKKRIGSTNLYYITAYD